jgi:hypothetical protein
MQGCRLGALGALIWLAAGCAPAPNSIPPGPLQGGLPRAPVEAAAPAPRPAAAAPAAAAAPPAPTAVVPPTPTLTPPAPAALAQAPALAATPISLPGAPGLSGPIATGGFAAPGTIAPPGGGSALGPGADAGLALAVEAALESAGQEAMPRARRLAQSSRQPLDRCALDMFIAVARGLGEGEAARWAVHLGERARASGDDELMPGLVTLAARIEQDIRAVVARGEAEVAEALGLEPERLRLAVAAARDARGRCPASLARRIVELTAEEGEEEGA